MTALNLDGLSAEQVIERFALLPLEGEGGYFSLVQRDEHGNAIYFLMTPGQFSAWHRLKERETWVLIGGDPLALHVRDEQYERIELSPGRENSPRAWHLVSGWRPRLLASGLLYFVILHRPSLPWSLPLRLW